MHYVTQLSLVYYCLLPMEKKTVLMHGGNFAGDLVQKLDKTIYLQSFHPDGQLKSPTTDQPTTKRACYCMIINAFQQYVCL